MLVGFECVRPDGVDIERMVRMAVLEGRLVISNLVFAPPSWNMIV